MFISESEVPMHLTLMNKLCARVSYLLGIYLQTKNKWYSYSLSVKLACWFVHYRWWLVYTFQVVILLQSHTTHIHIQNYLLTLHIILMCKKVMVAFGISMYILWSYLYFCLSGFSIQVKWKLNISSVSEYLNLWNLCRDYQENIVMP